MDLRIFEKQNQFVTFQLPYYHAKIKIQNFSIGKSFWSRKVLLGPLIEGTKLVVLEEIGFGNLYLIIGTNFGIFGRSRIGSENHTHWESSPGAETKAFPKTKKKQRHHLLTQTSVVRGFDRILSYWKIRKDLPYIFAEESYQKSTLQLKQSPWYIGVTL